MPMCLEAPVLQVDANVIHKVDTANPENLFSMWTVFARCRDSVAQGRRLENLSWRLWNRETFCCESGESFYASSSETQPKNINLSRYQMDDDLPQLSGSVDSLADDEAVDFSADSTSLDILRPRIQRQDSCASSRSRGRERHITSGDLEKMVVDIIEAKVPLTAPLRNSRLSAFPLAPPQEEKPSSSPEFTAEAERSGSTTTESPCSSSETASMESLQQATLAGSEMQSPSSRPTVVITGFSPSPIPASRITFQPAAKTPSPSAIPEPTDAPAPKLVQPKRQPPKFALGGSSGSGDDSYTDRNHVLEVRKLPVPQQKKKMFEVGGSSGEDSLKSALHAPRPGPLLNAQKKTASFNNQVVTQTYTSSAISDNEQSETDDVDESAIDDDDDSSEWEDSVEESGRSSVDEKFNFKRVDSKANLTSRRSLITLMLAQGSGRAQKLGNNTSQSTSALPRAARASLNGPSLVASPNDSDEAPLMMKRGTRAPPMRAINEIPRSVAQPINVAATNIHHQAALSPRTTRRNMLATELTESLRRQLLWERQQKSSTANAVLKRRHTSHDVANLKQYPEKPCMKDSTGVDATSWDQYFNKNQFTGYHAQGW
ncbi:hypothetical protein B0T17DRAFT_175245 [Bombardia bombarda]|uniref:Nitrogen regulatory protein areA GATA-like domain-containing protein n=1 Tax=Bombardia bombarda TaxID=252184 RepID=A0AA39X8D5_9PEZI|nr:hypothetical protein B0T17DRAFT_175245 [Bombardia bombarda]